MESNFEWITANGYIGIRFFHSIDDGGYSNPPHWHNDLEIIYLLEGRLKVRFGDGGERQTDFIDIVAWRSTAEFVSKYFTKGSMAAVSGRLQIREWTDREGGKRTTAEVVADNVYIGECKRRDGGYTSRPAAPSASAPAHRGSYGGYDNVPQGGSAFSELDDDDGDLPF